MPLPNQEACINLMSFGFYASSKSIKNTITLALSEGLKAHSRGIHDRLYLLFFNSLNSKGVLKNDCYSLST